MATKCPSACLDVLRSFPRTCAVQTKLASAMVVGKVSTMANKCAGKLAPISAEPYKPVTTPSEPLTNGTDTGTSTGSPVKKLWKPVIKRKMKVTSTPVDTAELKHEQSDAIARAKQEQAKAERKAAEAKAHLQAAKALEAEATSKQHLEAAKALEAEATASSDAPITAATDAPVTPAPKEGDEPLTDAPVPPVKKEKTIEFKESPMMMPVPGNLGVVAVHGMKMEPSEGGVPSMEVHLQPSACLITGSHCRWLLIAPDTVRSTASGSSPDSSWPTCRWRQRESTRSPSRANSTSPPAPYEPLAATLVSALSNNVCVYGSRKRARSLLRWPTRRWWCSRDQ